MTKRPKKEAKQKENKRLTSPVLATPVDLNKIKLVNQPTNAKSK